MRLLTTCPAYDGGLELKLEEFGGEVPSYAILSHTWGKDEILYADIQTGVAEKKAAYPKVMGAIEQASKDGCNYIWIDTLCIDKTSSAELSEAINSMYMWYQSAARCYAYLGDVDLDTPENFRTAKWWSRGWTLQELLAPDTVEFYTSSWQLLGSKIDLKDEIAAITGIAPEYLDRSAPVESASIARRMSWAATRETSRVEDIAYSLMGLFDVNMPMLYGEGKKAFLRLQEEILKQSDDQSIFAWQDDRFDEHGLLAESPESFIGSGWVIPYAEWEEHTQPLMTSKGLRVELHLKYDLEGYGEAALDCPYRDEPQSFLSIHIRRLDFGVNRYTRVKCGEVFPSFERGKLEEFHVRQSSRLSSGPGPVPFHYLALGERVDSEDGYYYAGHFSNVDLANDEAKHKPRGTAEAYKWVKTWDTVFPLRFKEGGKMCGRVLLKPLDKADPPIVILLGSLSPSEIGFDAYALPTAYQVPLQRIEESYSPKRPGEVIVAGNRTVQVTVGRQPRRGMHVYVVAIYTGKTLDSSDMSMEGTEARGKRMLRAVMGKKRAENA